MTAVLDWEWWWLGNAPEEGALQGGGKGRGWRDQVGNSTVQSGEMLRGDLPLAVYCVILVWAAISCPMNEYLSIAS